MFIPKDKIEWKKVPYLRQGESRNYDYELWLNEPLASWDVWDYWERSRVKSMEENLKKGDILFDIGTESGWCNIVYGDIVGAENMVLVEPTPEFWPNIKALWEENHSKPPLMCYDGFFSDKTTNQTLLQKRKFPASANGDLIDRNSYKYIHENSSEIHQIELDVFSFLTGIVPDAITIDVEGAELLVLKGAKNTLINNNVKVWVSEHDDLALKNYNTSEQDVSLFMSSIGYTREYLSTDHEKHIYYHK